MSAEKIIAQDMIDIDNESNNPSGSLVDSRDLEVRASLDGSLLSTPSFDFGGGSEFLRSSFDGMTCQNDSKENLKEACSVAGVVQRAGKDVLVEDDDELEVDEDQDAREEGIDTDSSLALPKPALEAAFAAARVTKAVARLGLNSVGLLSGLHHVVYVELQRGSGVYLRSRPASPFEVHCSLKIQSRWELSRKIAWCIQGVLAHGL
ncbi:unnamed protein product [Linum trigynum]|uniref:Uncharacterized protein n=1 Tax=Linum trigynum TaxID=586398 RepID=A0AAV2D7A2_9ROSI